MELYNQIIEAVLGHYWTTTSAFLSFPMLVMVLSLNAICALIVASAVLLPINELYRAFSKKDLF